MSKNYFLLLAMGGLLASGCGRERTAQEAASSAGVLGPADTSGRPQPSLAAAPGPADTAAAPAHMLAPPTAESAPAPHIKRGATVFADVPDDEPALETASEKPTSPTPASIAELTAFLQAGLPAPQVFNIRPGRDTLVTGPQGTQLLLPANAWDLPDSTATVQLTLQEFYTYTDMILAGLSTTAGPRLLETGGMLHITATANGQPVAVRPGAFVHLRMPAKEKKPGMQLFEGVTSGALQAVDWQLPQGQTQPLDVPLDMALRKLHGVRHVNGHRARRRRSSLHLKRASWPEYEGGDKQVQQDLDLLIGYSDATRSRLRRKRRITRAEKATLIGASQFTKQRILRVVQVKLVVDTAGVASQAQTLTDDATTDKQLNQDVLAAIAQLSEWEPAVQREYPQQQVRRMVAVEAARHLTVYFPETGPVLIRMSKWSNETLRRIKLSQEQKQHQADSVYLARKPYFDSLSTVAWKRAQERAAAELARIRAQFADTSKANISEAGVYEELSAQKLAWINLDRFAPATPIVTMGVNPGQTDAIVKLVFRQMRGVVNGTALAPDRVLFGVPQTVAVTLVALRRENGITYLATRDVKADALLYGGLVYRPVTLAELRAELNRLN